MARSAANSEVHYSVHGMPLFQALIFFTSVIVLVVATQWRPIHPFLVIVAAASAFGLLAGFPVAQLANNFGNGFAEKIYVPGLVIVASSLVAGLAESTAASDRLMAAIERWPKPWLGANWIAGFFGLIAGIGASPAAAFALLTPLLRPIGGKMAQSREPTAIALALAISASHGLLLLTPVPIAAAAILDAQWGRVALFGLPLALLLTAFAALFARRLSRDEVPEPPDDEPYPVAAEQSGGSAIVLVLAVAIPLFMLMVQSLGDIPSEPLGGGPARELVLGVGRPLILFLVGIGIMIAGQPRQSFGLLTDSAWTANILGNVSGVLLIVCAAGGLQRLCQETGMAELIGERLSGWHAGQLGVLIPFVVAAAIKTLQGSSLVAAITTAGMMQPLLMPLGLGDANGKALAALAIGAGAMTICHINDEYFWLVADRAGLTPLRGLTTLSLGTLLQGFIAAAALVLLSVLV
jgi:gluconate:H+ symporter, GntP family